MSFARFRAKSASCRAHTARRCSARGETQAVTLATLGTGDDTQEFDSYTGGETEKKFILHYNFPNFSVGETGRISGPGRREIGHGALAERSIEPMMPRIILTPSASPARSWSPTVPPRWPPFAAARSRCSMRAFR